MEHSLLFSKFIKCYLKSEPNFEALAANNPKLFELLDSIPHIRGPLKKLKKSVRCWYCQEKQGFYKHQDKLFCSDCAEYDLDPKNF